MIFDKKRDIGGMSEDTSGEYTGQEAPQREEGLTDEDLE